MGDRHQETDPQAKFMEIKEEKVMEGRLLEQGSKYIRGRLLKYQNILVNFEETNFIHFG